MEVDITLKGPSLQKQSSTSTELKLFTIENSKGTKLVVSNCGAAVVSLFVKDQHGLIRDVVLGYEDATEYLTDEFYIGTVVGRNANRIGGDTVLIDDHPHKISVKNGEFHHHGGTTGFNKKIFSAERLSQKHKNGIVFRYTSPHLEEGFPGELSLEVEYSLGDDDSWAIEYKAISNMTTLVNLTQHTYFNLTGDPRITICEHELKILSEYYLPVNGLQLPTGELAKVSNSAFDFTKFKQIAKDIETDDEQLKLSNGYDHSFVLEKLHTPILKHAAVVKEHGSGLRLDVYTTEPSMHLYTGNFLNNVTGKRGVIYQKRSGFCLETQHFPDAPNHSHFPSTVLQAGEQFFSKTIFRLSVDKSE